LLDGIGLEGEIEYETEEAENDGKITDPRYLMDGDTGH
jgi:hypothetical protein